MTGIAEAGPTLQNGPIELSSLEECLEYRFADKELLKRALTHASMSHGKNHRKLADSNNERLEFLGDRVLGLVIAHSLLEFYPKDAEGKLTDRLVAFVQRDALAEVAAKIELGRWLLLAAGEESIGGRSNPGILADCLEALIGALYIDGGLAPAEQFIRRHWHDQIRAMRKPPRDPKMALQEWAHAHTGGLPAYQLVDRFGPSHAPTFKVTVEIDGRGRETAIASSKRAAEKAAAARLLKQLEDA